MLQCCARLGDVVMWRGLGWCMGWAVVGVEWLLPQRSLQRGADMHARCLLFDVLMCIGYLLPYLASVQCRQLCTLRCARVYGALLCAEFA